MLALPDTTHRRLPTVELRETIVRITGTLAGGKAWPGLPIVARGAWLHWSRDGGQTFTRGGNGSLFLHN